MLDLKQLNCSDINDFEVLIATAVHNAYTDWEKKFMSDIHDRYIVHGEEIYMNKNQINKLLELQLPYEERKNGN